MKSQNVQANCYLKAIAASFAEEVYDSYLHLAASFSALALT